MRIALLAPAGAMHRHNGSFSKNLHYAPITLALLAALVPADLDADIKIHDETAGPIPLDLQADLIGITCITGTAPRSYRYADYFRKRGMTVVLGGVHPTLLPQEAILHSDSVVTGLAEENWPRLLRDYQKGRLQRFYHQEETLNLANRPLPRKDLLDASRYITMNTVEAVRGCSLPCNFCAYPVAFGKKIYTRPVKEVIAEIETFPGREVLFPDVNLLADYGYARELFTEMIPLKKKWLGLTTSAVGIDDDMIRLFARSGCKGLLIGFESISQSSQSYMNKGVNKVQSYALLMKKLHASGIGVMGCFAFGSDEEDKSVFARTVELAENIHIDLPRYAILTPFPRTELYHDMERVGRIVERDWSMYDVEHCVFKPLGMTKEELEQGIKWAWQETYRIKSIARRMELYNLKLPKLLQLITNLGYRKYAAGFTIYDESVMSDNSDIPLE